MATGDGMQNRKEVSRFDLVSTKEEEGIQLLLHGDGDGMQNRKKVVSRMGTAMAMLCKGLSTRNGVGVSCCVLRRRTNQGRR